MLMRLNQEEILDFEVMHCPKYFRPHERIFFSSPDN